MDIIQPSGDKSRGKINDVNPPEPMRIQEKSMIAVVRPLISELKRQGISAYIIDKSLGMYDARALPVISSHLDRYDLSALEFTSEDIRFLMTDPYGDMLRDPLLDGFIRDVAMTYPAEGEAQKRIRDGFVSEFELGQYRYFRERKPTTVEGHKRIVEEYKRIHVALEFMKQHRGYTIGLIDSICIASEHIRKNAYSLEEAYSQDYARGTEWLTDIGHFLKPVEGVMGLRETLGVDTKNKLKHPVSFMIVEDDPSYFWTLPFDRELGFQGYIKKFGLSDGYEYETFKYDSAEVALEAIGERSDLPEVVLTDIELGEGRINGLELARRLRKISTERGKDMTIFVYSSAIELYKEELECMRRDGVIQGYFKKQGFDVNNFIDAINQS